MAETGEHSLYLDSGSKLLMTYNRLSGAHSTCNSCRIMVGADGENDRWSAILSDELKPVHR